MKITLSVVATAALLAGAVASARAQTIATLESGGGLVSLVGSSGQEAPALQLIGGYGHIDFSRGEDYQDYLDSGDPGGISGAVSALSVISWRGTSNGPGNLVGTNGAAVVTQVLEDPFGGDALPHAISWQSPAASSVSLVRDGNHAGQLQTLTLGGGLVLTAPRTTGIATGGSLQMDNMRVDLSTGQVIADLTGTRSARGTQPAVAFSSPNTVMWTIGTVTGPTQVPPDALLSANPVGPLSSAGLTVVNPSTVTTYLPQTCYGQSNGYGYFPYSCPIAVTNESFSALRADIQLDSLELTSAGATFIADSLGLQATGVDALNGVNDASNPGKWGSLTVGAFFRAVDPTGALPAIPASIPEPSTYMLMGLGLVGVALTKRRRTQRAPA